MGRAELARPERRDGFAGRTGEDSAVLRGWRRGEGRRGLQDSASQASHLLHELVRHRVGVDGARQGLGVVGECPDDGYLGPNALAPTLEGQVSAILRAREKGNGRQHGFVRERNNRAYREDLVQAGSWASRSSRSSVHSQVALRRASRASSTFDGECGTESALRSIAFDWRRASSRTETSMTTSEHDTTPESQEPDAAGDTEKIVVVEPEFKITVRKLDGVARPRGVLAE